MKCPKCGSQDLKVNEKRDLEAEDSIRRRRECQSCGKRFTTYERIEIPSLLVVKKSGEKELFDRDKMAVGIRKALEKRPFGEDRVEEIIDELEREVNQHSDGEIKSTEIGDMVIKRLKLVDHVAYLRFASVYKSFNDVESFEKELRELKVK
jgi:transcriptional repressor NrdR